MNSLLSLLFSVSVRTSHWRCGMYLGTLVGGEVGSGE